MSTKKKFQVRRLVMVALFTALAYVVMIMIHFPVSFLTLDIKDAVITLCGLAFGPLSALFISVAVPFLEFVTISETGVYGLVMNILGSVSFSVTASVIYKYKKHFFGAVIGLLSGVFAMTAVMILFNLLITPYYTKMPVDAVAAMIPTLLLPFNLVKAVLNASIVLMLYKTVSTLLQKSGFLPKSDHVFHMDRRTVAVMVISLLLIVASVAVVFEALGGEFTWGIQNGSAG